MNYKKNEKYNANMTFDKLYKITIENNYYSNETAREKDYFNKLNVLSKKINNK